jgi:hypothetical protein
VPYALIPPTSSGCHDQLYLRVVARYDIKPLNAAGIFFIIIITTPTA